MGPTVAMPWPLGSNSDAVLRESGAEDAVEVGVAAAAASVIVEVASRNSSRNGSSRHSPSDSSHSIHSSISSSSNSSNSSNRCSSISGSSNNPRSSLHCTQGDGDHHMSATDAAYLGTLRPSFTLDCLYHNQNDFSRNRTRAFKVSARITLPSLGTTPQRSRADLSLHLPPQRPHMACQNRRKLDQLH